MNRRLAIFTAVAPLFAAEQMSNDDVIKLAKAKMSDGFIIDLIQTKPGRYDTDASRLVTLKEEGVGDAIIVEMMAKSAPAEALNSDSIIKLSKAGFSDEFMLNAIQKYPSSFATDTARIVAFKEAGLSEKVISAMVERGARLPSGAKIPSGTVIGVRTIDAIESANAKPGDRFRASLDEPLEVDGQTLAPKGADVTLLLTEESSGQKIKGKASLSVELVEVTVGEQKVNVQTDAVTETGGSATGSTVKRTAIVGGIGAVIGAIAGGGKGAAIGAGAGAAAGAGSKIFTKGEQVSIPSETSLQFKVR